MAASWLIQSGVPLSVLQAVGTRRDDTQRCHLTPHHFTELSDKLTPFLQKMSQICPTRKNQRLEEVDNCWFPYRIRYKHITNWFYLTMQVKKTTHTPKCTPIYFSADENWLFIVQFRAQGTFSHVGNIRRYKTTPKFMCGKISLYTCKMCWFGWFSCLKT